MTPEQIIKQASIDAINDALKSFRGPSYVEPPKQVVASDRYKKLSRHQIDQGVIAFVHACNLSGGSIVDMDLYKLVRAYLWDQQGRKEINALVSRCGV
jgi:hypothetical protein